MTKLNLKYIGPLVFLTIVLVFLVGANLDTYLNLFNLRSRKPYAVSPQPNVNGRVPVKANYAPFELPKIDTTASQKEITAFTEEIGGLIKGREFDKLEAKAAEYRQTKARFIGGGWKLYSLSSLISSPLSGNNDDAWKKHFAFLEDWKSKIPDSLMVRTAQANSYIEYAWLIRGDDYAADVVPEKWPEINERIKKAAEILHEAANLESRSPEYYEARLDLARVMGLHPINQKTIYDEAIAFEPEYQYFYTTMAINLMERWGGRPGEWDAFAERVKTDIGGPHGLELYYRIVAAVIEHKGQYFGNQSAQSWNDAREGFRLINAEYGVTRAQLNKFVQIAFKRSDADAMCPTIDQIQGDNYDPSSWKDLAGFKQTTGQIKQFCQMVETQKSKAFDPDQIRKP